MSYSFDYYKIVYMNKKSSTQNEKCDDDSDGPFITCNNLTKFNSIKIRILLFS